MKRKSNNTVIVEISSIVKETPRAILAQVKRSEETWFPKKLVDIKVARKIKFYMPKFLADEKNVPYYEYRHVPEYIEPIYSQELIDELRFNSK